MSRFEPPPNRRPTSSVKWTKYAEHVLPFWVADMDLPCAPFIIEAVKERLEHPILGYTDTPKEAVDAFLGWARCHYDWHIEEDWLVWIPGVVPGFNLAARAAADRGRDLVIPVPVYYPFLDVPTNAGLNDRRSPLACIDGRWCMDFEHLSRAMTKDAAAVMFCNPQNPTGRVYDREELERLAELALAADAVIISDEIHCSILLGDRPHIPIATLDERIAERSISLFAATKTYNFPGLGCAVAVIPDAALRERYKQHMSGLVSHVSPLAFAATIAAYNDESSWIPELNAFLKENEALLRAFIDTTPGLATTPVEGTYLSWIDARELNVPNVAAHFEAHGLGLSPGEDFGGDGFVRFNFACPVSLLQQGIERMEAAVAAV